MLLIRNETLVTVNDMETLLAWYSNWLNHSKIKKDVSITGTSCTEYRPDCSSLLMQPSPAFHPSFSKVAQTHFLSLSAENHLLKNKKKKNKKRTLGKSCWLQGSVYLCSGMLHFVSERNNRWTREIMFYTRGTISSCLTKKEKKKPGAVNAEKGTLATLRYPGKWFGPQLTLSLVEIISWFFFFSSNRNKHALFPRIRDLCFLSGFPSSVALQTKCSLCLPSVEAAPAWRGQTLTDNASKLRLTKCSLKQE